MIIFRQSGLASIACLLLPLLTVVAADDDCGWGWADAFERKDFMAHANHGKVQLGHNSSHFLVVEETPASKATELTVWFMSVGNVTLKDLTFQTEGATSASVKFIDRAGNTIGDKTEQDVENDSINFKWDPYVDAAGIVVKFVRFSK